MLRILIEKELKAILLSPKFAATFAVSAVLIVMSVAIGIREYRANLRQYETARALALEEGRQQQSWRALEIRVYRRPDPLQIFVSGVQYDIGRLANISSQYGIKLRNSTYSDDPIFAVFRFLDFGFIVTVVLSLLAILFTYEAINGERERGTLRLTFANAVPRVHYILGKFVGSWVGLVLPLSVPILLGLLLVLLYRIPYSGEDWLRLALLLGVSGLFFTFFMAIGLLVSALTRRSATSFLILLVCWVFFTLVIPRAGVMLAAQMVHVPSVAEIDAQISGYSRERWKQHMDELGKRWQERMQGTEHMTPEERESWRDDHSWAWMEEDEKARQAMLEQINAYAENLKQDFRNRKMAQDGLAFRLARFSPVSAYQLAAMHLMESDAEMKTRYEDAMSRYRAAFLDYREAKQKAAGDQSAGGIRITFNSDTGFKMQLGREGGTLDLSDMPQFDDPRQPLRAAIAALVPDVAILLGLTLVAFAGAFVAFLRYDVR